MEVTSVTNIEETMRQAPKVMLFCPVRLRAEQIPDMIACHMSLTGIDKIIYLDDCEPEASRILHEAIGEDHPDVDYLNIQGIGASQYNAESHNWEGSNLARITAIRNVAIIHFLSQTEYTHLFILDADLLLHPRTVESLLAADKPVIANIFWSKWRDDQPYMPNCWDIHGYIFNTAHSITRLATPGVYEVGGTGACTLIARDVLARGVNYTPIPQWREAGEDRAFSMKCNVIGVPMFVDTTYPAFHVYRADQLAEARQWRDLLGCSPRYFDGWLDTAWKELVERIAGTQPVAQGRATPISLACCLPGETFSSRWVVNWTALQIGFHQTGIWYKPVFTYSSNVYVTRGAIWADLRSNSIKTDYILWIDDDNILDFGQLQSMISTLETTKELDMVVGWCRTAPEGYSVDVPLSCGHINDAGLISPLTLETMQEADSDLISIGYSGFPAVLMRGSLIERLTATGIEHPFTPIVDKKFMWGISGEDYAFCWQLRQIGARIAVDRRIKVPHLKLRDDSPDRGIVDMSDAVKIKERKNTGVNS